jgi:hypothetical protein
MRLEGALHHMNMGDKLNIIDNSNAFLFTIWLDEMKGIHWEKHEAYNQEPLLQAMRCMSVLLDSFQEGWYDNIYLKSIVWTGGKLMAD